MYAIYDCCVWVLPAVPCESIQHLLPSRNLVPKGRPRRQDVAENVHQDAAPSGRLAVFKDLLFPLVVYTSD